MAGYTEVTDEALEDFLAEYDIGSIVAFRGIAEGVENSNYSLKTTQGDFILTHRMYRTYPPFPEFKMINVFDLFRMTPDGRADEHWDIMEEIPSEADLAKMF